METSALYIVAQKYGMRAVAVHVISDLPLVEKTLFDQVMDTEKERRGRAHSRTVEAMVKAAKKLANES